MWREVTAQRVGQKRLMHKVLLALQQREPCMAMNSLAALLSAAQRMRHYANLIRLREARGMLATWAEVTRQAQLVRSVVLRMSNRVLAACWAAWMDELEASRTNTFTLLESCAANVRRAWSWHVPFGSAGDLSPKQPLHVSPLKESSGSPVA